jgi:hypothetical protein
MSFKIEASGAVQKPSSEPPSKRRKAGDSTPEMPAQEFLDHPIPDDNDLDERQYSLKDFCSFLELHMIVREEKTFPAVGFSKNWIQKMAKRYCMASET